MPIEGTVRIDHSEELNNLYDLARRAKQQNNIENAAKFYDMILLKDPSSWEANFFSVYYKAFSSKNGEIAYTSSLLGSCIESTFSLIKDNVALAEEKTKAIEEVRVYSFNCSDQLRKAAENLMVHSPGFVSSVKVYSANIVATDSIKNVFYDKLVDIFGNDEQVMKLYGVRILKSRLNEGVNQKVVDKFAPIIKKYEPAYVAPQGNNKTAVQQAASSSSSSSSGGGCYVATAVYGSYDCPEVWTLRRYRDYDLAETWYGRAFVRIYYAISPSLVKWFGHTKWFKKMWRGKLDRLVKRLQKKGFESTPYEDRIW